jgi:UDP-N-acetylmuramoyl-L-alanyl-D-glutamate--2,6-diaminopimelate ligase
LETIEITGIALDSRQVENGNLFIALKGGNVDGHQFIPQAIQRGAAAVVGTEQLSGLAVPYLYTGNGRLALAYLSAAFYDFPARKMTMVGVTGTDGKTTTANMIFNILRATGQRVGMVSTVSAIIGDEEVDTGFHVTTPEAPELQRFLSKMVERDSAYAVLEVTSHGLDQQRVAVCDFDIGVVTNITHEHLDYHGTFEAYRAAKARLFSGLSETGSKLFHPPRGAVLNRDDLSYDYLSAITSVRQISYGLDEQSLVRAERVTYLPDGLQFVTSVRHDSEDIRFPVSCRVVGEFNLSNCLAAIGVSCGFLNIAKEAIQAGLREMPAVPGRMEAITMGQDFIAYVDFAHTPNALRNALKSARRLTEGRVIAVFGSAGLRDREKRYLMAEIAASLADLFILTAEDPRTESLEVILSEMASGAARAGGREGKNYWRMPDRGEAIRFAISLARPGDVVIVCGKGHEQSMCFGDIEYAWDDRLAMRAALAEQLGVAGPSMPYLPTQD